MTACAMVTMLTVAHERDSDIIDVPDLAGYPDDPKTTLTYIRSHA